MQSFLPYPDFDESAWCLDDRRLGKQRVEAMQILRIVSLPEERSLTTGWGNHPAVRMWRGHRDAVGRYMNAMIREWVRRGHRNTMVFYTPRDLKTAGRLPPWLGREDFHASHRSNLLRKAPEHYGGLGWTEPPDLPYVWPVGRKEQT